MRASSASCAHARRPLAYQAHENVLEGALMRLEILDRNRQLAHLVQEQRDAGIAPSVEGAYERAALIPDLRPPRGEFGRYLRERGLQMQREPLLAELAHQRRLLLDED